MTFFNKIKYTALLAVFVFAGNSHAMKIGDIVDAGGATLMFVEEFNTPEKNDIFNYNLGVMRNYAAKIAAYEKAVKSEKDAAKLEKIKADLKKLEREFKVNDNEMRRIFHFASDRKYKMVFDKSNICMPLSDAEISTFTSADGVKLDPLKIVKKGGTSYYRLRSIKGAKANDELQRELNFSLSKKISIENTRKKIAATTNPNMQIELAKQLSADEAAFAENENKFRQKYGLNKTGNYLVEVENSKLYLVLTPTEAQTIKIQKAQAEKNGTLK